MVDNASSGRFCRGAGVGRRRASGWCRRGRTSATVRAPTGYRWRARPSSYSVSQPGCGRAPRSAGGARRRARGGPRPGGRRALGSSKPTAPATRRRAGSRRSSTPPATRCSAICAGQPFHPPLPDGGPRRRPVTEVDWVSGHASWPAGRPSRSSVGSTSRTSCTPRTSDLCWRARRAGWGVVYVPVAVGHPFQGISTARRPYRMLVSHHRSALRFATGRDRGLAPAGLAGDGGAPDGARRRSSAARQARAARCTAPRAGRRR